MVVPGKISILMPLYNGGLFFAPCLQSIQALPATNWELIIADGNSTDQSLVVAKRLSKNDSRIKIVSNPDRAIIQALRLAYAEADGEFITRMDADDFALPGRLELLRKALQEKGPGHVAIGQVEYFSDGYIGDGYLRYAKWLNDLTASGKNFDERYRECTVPSVCWMTTRDDLDAAGAFDANVYPEDYDLAMRFYQQHYKIAPVPEVVMRWRDHPLRTTRNSETYADNRFLQFKVDWFLKADRDYERPLVLWGAGAKGKHIARMLGEKNVAFRWMTNNPNKVGQHIHNVVLEDESEVSSIRDAQIIVAVAGLDDQQDIAKQLLEAGYTPGDDALFFS